MENRMVEDVQSMIRIDDYLKANAKKMKPYRGKLKELKCNIEDYMTNHKVTVINMGEEEHLCREERRRKLPLSKSVIEQRVACWYDDDPEKASSLADHICQTEYETAFSIRRKKGPGKGDSNKDEDELSFDGESDAEI